MNTIKLEEKAVIRSRALTVLFSVILSALILLPFITSAKGKGAETPSGEVYMHPLNKELHAGITLTNFSEGQYKIAIESVNGSEVYYDKVVKTNKDFAKIFDLSVLNDGEYALNVESKNDITQRYFSIKEGKIKVNYNTVVSPEFSVVDNKALVSINNKSNNDYAIKIISPEGDEVYESFDNKSKINKSFDFSKVDKGSYTVLVVSGNKEFTFEFAN